MACTVWHGTCEFFGGVEKGHVDSQSLPLVARDADIPEGSTLLHNILVHHDLVLQRYLAEATALYIDLIHSDPGL